MIRNLFLLIVFFLLSSQAFPFTVEPARIEISAPAGSQRGRRITIDNSESDEPLSVKIYAQDISYLPDGTHDFLPKGATDWSCANWIRVVPEQIDIPERKRGSVRVSLSVPPNVQGGRYAILFFESAPVPFQRGIGASLRIGVMISVTIPKTEIHKARITNLSFIKPRDIEVSLFNEGNILLRPEGKVKIIDSRGKKIKSLSLNPHGLGILPSTLRKFIVPLEESLEKGEYKIKAEIDFGADYLLVGESPIKIE